MVRKYIINDRPSNLSEGAAVPIYRVYTTVHPVIDNIVALFSDTLRIRKKDTIKGNAALYNKILALQAQGEVYIATNMTQEIAKLFLEHSSNTRTLESSGQQKFIRTNSDDQDVTFVADRIGLAYIELADTV